jgi:hypothetical protein
MMMMMSNSSECRSDKWSTAIVINLKMATTSANQVKLLNWFPWTPYFLFFHIKDCLSYLEIIWSSFYIMGFIVYAYNCCRRKVVPEKVIKICKMCLEAGANKRICCNVNYCDFWWVLADEHKMYFTCAFMPHWSCVNYTIELDLHMHMYTDM